MAYKITHWSGAQELRFSNQRSAERYADRVGGGLGKWRLTIAGGNRSEAAPPGVQHDRERT